MSSRTPVSSLESKHYESTEVESSIYKLWESRAVFAADPNSKKPPYSIVIPPPNVTGRLHMGHALNNSVQDTLIRLKRMDGFDALWVPGTDHAGISTQSVVKKHLDAEGISYLELGREKMIERIWQWKQKYGDQILMQLRRMGCSCDWNYTRFTMDDGLSQAVLAAFKRLYDDGLIYRGKYIVNWCPVDRTALSDDEVVTTEGGEPGHLWHFSYPLTDGSGFLTIATTRPETMLGDAAIAVNPKDERYTHLLGKFVTLPLVGRAIPIIADDYVDREFGTGCLKVTPAHDPYDFQIGQRHNLPQINVMNEDATMSGEVPEEYRGLDRFVCREKVVEAMKALDLVVKIESRMTPVGRAQRSRAVIEYRLSDQWFVKMKPLADAALKASAEGKISLYPERWENIYRAWLENTRDWCISRQIWWGHRIPAWYHRETGEILVDSVTPARVEREPEAWRRDEDVLDTWFSSALWPYSTLGWPANTVELQRYYPTSVLSTAKDIIYFWVARMVMTGLRFMDQVPFKQVYFHPVVCDAAGETMSKSKGNGIDPLHVIEGATMQQLEEPIYEARAENMQETLARLHASYPEGFKGVGADALRLTLLSLNSQAQQVQISLQKFEETGRRFTEKLWNAARFVISGLADAVPASVESAPAEPEDRWILGRLDVCVREVRSAVDSFLFNEAVSAFSRFFWDEFCDWYVELVKARLRKGDDSDKRRVQETLAESMSTVLRLIHPFTPFITEELWGHLHPLLVKGGFVDETLLSADVCALAPYPVDRQRTSEQLGSEFALYQDIVRGLRNMRSHAGLEGSAELATLVRVGNPELRAAIERGRTIIQRGAKLKSLDFTDQKPERMAAVVVDAVEVFANLAEHMDIPAEIARNEAVLKKIEVEIAKLQGKLSNEGFLAKAPAAVVEGERKSLGEAQDRRQKVLATLAELRS